MVDKEAQESSVYVSFKTPRIGLTSPAQYLEYMKVRQHPPKERVGLQGRKAAAAAAARRQGGVLQCMKARQLPGRGKAAMEGEGRFMGRGRPRGSSMTLGQYLL